jgi:small subunit ribosomal protein S6
MRNYELALLIEPKQTLEPKAWTEKLKKWLVKGQIGKEENWGLKKLAYPIKKQSEALYYFYTLKVEPESLAALEKKLKLDESILRYLIINKS